MKPLLAVLIPLLLLAGLPACGGYEEEEGRIYRWVVRNGRQYGYINRSGETVVSMQFAYANPFAEGLGGVNVGGTTQGATGRNMPTDGKWGFVNEFGRFVINPKYDSPPNGAPIYDLAALSRILHDAYVFSEGLSVVYLNREWMYIDQNERVWYRNPDIRAAGRFHEGMAPVYLNGAWGYLKQKRNAKNQIEGVELAIQPQFLYPVPFQEGKALVMDKNRRRIVIDRQNKRLFPQYRIETNFYEGVATVKSKFLGELITYKDELTYGLVDSTGNFLFEPQFDEVGRFGNGLCPVRVGSKPGELEDFPEQKQVENYIGGKWGYVDRKGVLQINPIYDEAKGFSEGIAAVRKGNLWAFIDVDGHLLTEYEFYWTGYYHDGMVQVLLGPPHNAFNEKYAYLNHDAEIVWIEP